MRKISILILGILISSTIFMMLQNDGGNNLEAIPLLHLDQSHISNISFQGQIDTEGVLIGESALVHLDIDPRFYPVNYSGVHSTINHNSAWLMDGGENNPEGKYNIDLPLHADEIGIKGILPVLFSLKVLMENQEQGTITKLWRFALPEESKDLEIEITPCLYRSNLAFRVEPDIEIDKLVLVCFVRPGVPETLQFEKIDEISVYAPFNPASRNWLSKRGLRSPDMLRIWDSEKYSLKYTGQTIFYAHGINTEKTVLSNVYIS